MKKFIPYTVRKFCWKKRFNRQSLMWRCSYTAFNFLYFNDFCSNYLYPNAHIFQWFYISTVYFNTVQVNRCLDVNVYIVLDKIKFLGGYFFILALNHGCCDYSRKSARTECWQHSGAPNMYWPHIWWLNHAVKRGVEISCRWNINTIEI
jgi:hypothetical protein